MHPLQAAQRRSAARSAVSAALVFLALIIFIIPLLSLPASAAAASADRVVRVGYFNNGDFMHKSSDGGYAGYDIEYYCTLAGYAGWDLRFVEYDNLNAALDGLSRGDVDVMSGLSKTTEREAKYLVSNQKMCTSHIAVQARADDDRFAAGDTAGMADMTCGILRGSNVAALYADWCHEHGLTPHIVEYDSLTARNDALSSGQVDAVAAGSTIPGAQKIAEFPALDLYFMFNKGQAALKSQFDRAMEILALESPAYTTTLYASYFPVSRNTSPSFSAAEKAFIAAHPTVRVAVLENDAPFSSKAKDGSAAGILPEYFAHLSKTVGIDFQCMPYASKDAAFAALSAGEVDAVGKAENDIFEASKRRVILTVPYLRMTMVQITRAGTASVTDAVVPACNETYVSKALESETPDLQPSLRSAVNSETAFAALKAGKTDSVICTQPAATWLLNRNRASEYVVSAFGSGTWDVSCALPGGEAGNTLRSILNKSVTADGTYISQLITSDTLEDSANLTSIFDRLSVTSIAALAIIAVLLLLVVAAALAVIVRRHRAEKRLAARQTALAAEEEANRAKRAFFGTVSHDMRTPLNGIVGFTERALKSDDPAQIRDYLQKIRASSSVLSDLVNDTLVLSRTENDKYVLTPAACDMAEVLSELLTPIRALADEKGVHFADNIAEVKPRSVLADRLSVQKVVLNLLVNAVKFTPAGGTVTLRYALDPANGPDPDSVITVSDTGVGISDDFLPQVFEPFSQENPLNAETTGSGLGLSIVQSLVDAMGGTIGVQSRKGSGSTFTVRLHLAEADVCGAGETAAAAPADPQVLQGRRVLVCEDSPLNREILSAILEEHGMHPTGAENGKKGLETFAASAPGFFDVILMDIRMPLMDGRAATRAIRALDREDAGTVPIFAVSADAYPEDVAECLAAGMNGHFAKPVNDTVLIETLARTLAR